jgi:hypothetical protein
MNRVPMDVANTSLLPWICEGITFVGVVVLVAWKGKA